MTRVVALLPIALALAGCGLQPLYQGGGSGAVARPIAPPTPIATTTAAAAPTARTSRRRRRASRSARRLPSTSASRSSWASLSACRRASPRAGGGGAGSPKVVGSMASVAIVDALGPDLVAAGAGPLGDED